MEQTEPASKSSKLGVSVQGVLGSVIGQKRAAKNIRQIDIANALGLTVSTWSRIERGESAVTLEQLVLVSELLEEPLSRLFAETEVQMKNLLDQGVRLAASKAALEESSVLPLSGTQLKALTNQRATPETDSNASFLLPLAGVLGGAIGLLGYATYNLIKKSQPSDQVGNADDEQVEDSKHL